jgi:hypothetical protein
MRKEVGRCCVTRSAPVTPALSLNTMSSASQRVGCYDSMRCCHPLNTQVSQLRQACDRQAEAAADADAKHKAAVQHASTLRVENEQLKARQGCAAYYVSRQRLWLVIIVLLAVCESL